MSQVCQDRTAVSPILAIVLAFLAVSTDALTWIELDIAAIYGLPLVVVAVTRRHRLLWTLAVLLIIATFAVYAAQIPAGAFALHESFFVNRALDAVALLLTAGLLHVWMTSVAVKGIQARLLSEQNEKLESANAELVRREVQIARQNEELDRRRHEAEEASGRKTQLLAAASHDIRTPVNAINLMAQVIGRSADDPALTERIPYLAQRLQANALSLVDLVSNLLDIAHFDSGHIARHESVFSLNELVASKCRDLLPFAQAKAIRLEATVPECSIWLQTDRIKLDRVVSNLVANAIKFTETGSVVVSASITTGREALICIRDTGTGIASDKIESIFNEFAQLDVPGDDRNSGWGLGLAICRRLVRLLGGVISVESELNQGSAFTVRLPSQCLVDAPKVRTTVPS